MAGVQAFLAPPASCCLNALRRAPSLRAARHGQFLHTSSSCSSPLAVHPRPLRLSFSVKAMEISGPGSVDSSLMVAMHDKLKEQLRTDEVIVKDAYGDGRHVSIDVVSLEFEGKSSVNRQRMVYKAIWEELQTTVHAVDNMRTRTPAEAAEEKSKQTS